MIKKIALNISVALMLLMIAGPVNAVEIKYNEQNRPVEFIGLDVGGNIWNVTVTWTGTMRDTYTRNGVYVQPTFFGDAAADDAAVAMQQALLAEEYTGDIWLTSYLWVPKTLSSWYSGPGVWLHKVGLTISPVNVSYGNAYGTVGFTRFRVFTNSFEGGETE